MLQLHHVWGLSAVVITDTMQSAMMLLAGFIIAYFTLSQPEIGGLFGLLSLDSQAPTTAQKLHLYLPSNHPDLPWTGVFTGLIILHSFYFTTNQYLVQRILAAKTDEEAGLGILVAGFLKLTVPFFTIICGVAAGYLFQVRLADQKILPDDAFICLVQLVVPMGYGLIGFILAGLTAAIFSSVDSMMNSVSTLITLDIYQKYIKPKATDVEMVHFGQIVVVVFVFLSCFLAWISYSPDSTGNFFLKVSSQGSYFTQGVFVTFLVGIIWRKAHPKAAVIVMLIAPIFAVLLEWSYNHFLGQALGLVHFFGEKLNFLHRVFISFLFCMSLLFVLSKLFSDSKKEIDKDVFLKIPRGSQYWIIGFIALQSPLWCMAYWSISSPRGLTLWGGLLTWIIFALNVLVTYKKVSSAQQRIRLVAGVLTGLTVSLLYYFY